MDPELGKFKAGSGSGINHFGSTTLLRPVFVLAQSQLAETAAAAAAPFNYNNNNNRQLVTNNNSAQEDLRLRRSRSTSSLLVSNNAASGRPNAESGIIHNAETSVGHRRKLTVESCFGMRRPN